MPALQKRVVVEKTHNNNAFWRGIFSREHERESAQNEYRIHSSKRIKSTTDENIIDIIIPLDDDFDDDEK